jgi:two-component system OmpR family response regulator
MRILVIEDEPEMARLIASLLAQAGFVVDRVTSLEDTREAVRQSAYDLLLLDRRLPDDDGISLLPSIRRARPGIRVIMLTALDATKEKVSGFEAGADDYLTKPFEGEELIARVRACLRRPGFDALPILTVGRLSLNPSTRQVLANGTPVVLHRRELMLLEALMRQASRVTTRESLLDEVYSRHEDVQQNTLDTLVSRLRRRLTQVDSGVAIHTLKGLGYMLTEAGA